MVMETKVTTVIVNATKHGLTMKVGNRQCYAKLTSLKVDGQYNMQLDMNWTYQEFMVHDKAQSDKRVLLSSDDCCDYERITIVESSDGKLDIRRQLRPQFRTSCTPEDASRSTWKSWLCKMVYA